jgi:hypothetical protein
VDSRSTCRDRPSDAGSLIFSIFWVLSSIRDIEGDPGVGIVCEVFVESDLAEADGAVYDVLLALWLDVAEAAAAL